MFEQSQFRQVLFFIITLWAGSSFASSGDYEAITQLKYEEIVAAIKADEPGVLSKIPKDISKDEIYGFLDISISQIKSLNNEKCESKTFLDLITLVNPTNSHTSLTQVLRKKSDNILFAEQSYESVKIGNQFDMLLDKGCGEWLSLVLAKASEKDLQEFEQNLTIHPQKLWLSTEEQADIPENERAGALNNVRRFKTLLYVTTESCSRGVKQLCEGSKTLKERESEELTRSKDDIKHRVEDKKIAHWQSYQADGFKTLAECQASLPDKTEGCIKYHHKSTNQACYYNSVVPENCYDMGQKRQAEARDRLQKAQIKNMQAKCEGLKNRKDKTAYDQALAIGICVEHE